MKTKAKPKPKALGETMIGKAIASSKKPLRSIKTLKELLVKMQVDYWATRGPVEKELEAAKKHKQEVCPHPDDKIRTRNMDYMEEGRMRAPVEWQEKYCCRCGKVLAHGSASSKVIWNKVK